MLAFKLTIVPLFIALVTLAGRRWGSRVVGILGGLPIIAGPIIVIIAIEQGRVFGALAATAAISAVAAVIAFGIAYSWASRRWLWPQALACAVAAWAATAILLSIVPHSAWISAVIAGVSLWLAPRLLPPGSAATEGTLTGARGFGDLPYRMFTGALLTVAVSGTAALIGGTWSGLLAVFPIIGTVLAVFTHRTQGPGHVALVYRGMMRGLCSFTAFFMVLALWWPRGTLLMSVTAGVAAAVLVQGVIQLAALLKGPRRG